MRIAGHRLTAMLAVSFAGGASFPVEAQDASGSGQARAALRSSETVNPRGARYDRATGTCSVGSQQLMDSAEFRQRIDGWEMTKKACMGVTKASVPATAAYPALFAKLRASGSARVMVRLEGDGTVESARAVCATDRAFGDAAEATARAIKYAPSTCDGKPTGSVFLVPFDYSF